MRRKRKILVNGGEIRIIHADNLYTIETVPTSIRPNQFYCLEVKTGKITIGDYMGKSAISSAGIFIVNGNTHKVYGDEADKKSVTISTKYKGFFDYQDLLAEYKKHFDNKKDEKVKSSSKTRYLVNKRYYTWYSTRGKNTPYDCKEFSNKEDAVTYSEKGVKKIRKLLDKYYIELEALHKLLSKFYLPKDSIYNVRLSSLAMKPSKLKEGDLLIKVETKKYGDYYSFPEIKENYTAHVKELISTYTARLNDGTLLLEQECFSSAPCFIKIDDFEAAKNRIRYFTIGRLKSDIEEIKHEIDKAKAFYEKYVPLKGCRYASFWFSKKRTDELIKTAKTYLDNVDHKITSGAVSIIKKDGE